MDLTGSMLEMEDKIVPAVDATGNLASGEALKCFDADAVNLTIGGMVWCSKGKQKNPYQTRDGTVAGAVAGVVAIQK